MTARRVILFLVVALLIFAIITQPEDAADVVQTIAATFRDAAESIGTFFSELM